MQFIPLLFAANDMLVFMLNWYEKFPSYKSRELFLTGESYAGNMLKFILCYLFIYFYLK